MVKMINEENLDKINKSIIKKDVLTTKELNEYGFNSLDLKNLVTNNTLKRIKRGYYSLASVNDLFFYGKRLLVKKEYERANECFKRCFELDPNNNGACFQLFFYEIQKENYEKAFKYFEVFYNANTNDDNKFYNSDNNFYLYLLNMIIKLPEKYNEIVASLEFKDIRVDFKDKRYEKTKEQNEFRSFAFNKKFLLAMKKLNILIEKTGNRRQNIIIKGLLSKAIEVQKEKIEIITNLAKEKEYDKLIEFLERLNNEHKLSMAEEYTLLLAKELNNTIKTNMVPQYTYLAADNFFEAIDKRNFNRALKLNLEYVQSLNQNIKENTNHILLKEITKLTLVNSKKEVKEHKKENVYNKEFLISKLEELEKRGIIILEPMNDEEIEEVNNIICNISNIKSFTIGENPKQIVLKYHIKGYIEVRDLIQKASNAYDEKDFELATELYKNVLMHLKTPSTFIYAKLGKSYMQLCSWNFIDIAIDYLTVASELSKNEEFKYNFKNLVESLNKELRYRKSYVKMTESEFDNDLYNYYGIKKIEEIAHLVSSGISLDTVCDTFKLTDEEKNIVYLIFAREFYSKEIYILGDKYIKLVEKTKDKTEFVKTLLEEVKKNKKFYKNKVEEEHKKLLLDN